MHTVQPGNIRVEVDDAVARRISPAQSFNSCTSAESHQQFPAPSDPEHHPFRPRRALLRGDYAITWSAVMRFRCHFALQPGPRAD